MEWIGLTSSVCFVSALVPVVNTEIYLVGLVTQQPQLPWWLLGPAAAVGQMAGKRLFYYAARGSLRLPARLQRHSGWSGGGRWSRRLVRFQETCRERPAWAVGVLLVSASLGLPPFLMITVIAGMARIPVTTFLVTGLAGRFARFAAIAASPGVVRAWWF